MFDGQLFRVLPRHVKNLSADELNKYFPSGTPKAFLMRSIIMNEKQYSTIDYDRTLRGMWYSTVKPTLDKLGLLESNAMTEEGLQKWDKTLSEQVAILLRRGFLTYKSLHIADVSRQKENPSQYYKTDNLTIYGHQITVAPYSNIIIATEKDTVYQNIKDIAKLFGCSCISCKGQNSLGAMEVLVRGMNLNDVSVIYILTMTDYDPAGYYIAEALETQVNDILAALDMSDIRVYIQRVGITPDQLDPDVVEANKYSPKPANLEKWLERTGGINGEPKGLELDALTPTQIRTIFVSHLIGYVDILKYESFLKESYITTKVLDALAPYVRKITKKVIRDYKDKLELKKFSVEQLAISGFSTFPVDRLCSTDYDDKINMDSIDFIKDIDEDNEE